MKFDFNTKFNKIDKDIYLTFSSKIKEISVPRFDKLDETLSNIKYNQIGLPIRGCNGITIITSEKHALCLTFGIDDYKPYTDLLENCFYKTFVYEGITYITIIHKELLDSLIEYANTVCHSNMKSLPTNIYIRINSITQDNRITNIKPDTLLEKYIKIHNPHNRISEDNKLINNLSIKFKIDSDQIDDIKNKIDEFNKKSNENIQMKIENEKS